MLSARPRHDLVINHKLRISIRSTRTHSRQPLTKLCLPVAATQLVRLHTGKCSCDERSQACRGKGQPHCNCSTPVSSCDVCDPCQHQFSSSICDTCSTMGIGDSYPGTVYDEPIVTDSYSSEPMILPGETIIDGGSILPDTFSGSGDCPHCQSTNGPIFQGTIVPGP